mgnify:CR=1 FL=1
MGSSGDQGNALDFSLSEPGGLVVAPDGTVLIADARNHRILRLTVQFQGESPSIDPPPINNGDVTADFNADGKVDFFDFLPFAEAFGGADPGFDLDEDGFIGFADFLIFVNAFGRPTSSNPAITRLPSVRNHR